MELINENKCASCWLCSRMNQNPSAIVLIEEIQGEHKNTP